MGLSINQTFAKIGIQSSPAKMEIQSSQAKLELHQKHAKVNIRSRLPKVKIDQKECFASAGLKNPHDFTKETSQLAYQHVMEYISKVMSDGDRFAAIEKGGNPIADIAERDAYPVHEYGLSYIPKARPVITLKEGSLNIEAEKNSEGVNNGVEGKYTPGDVSFDFTPAKIGVYLRQKASISFSNKGSSIDTQI